MDHLQKEWQQCRGRIDAVDGTLADLRKFGFSLITGLLAATGLVGGAAGLLGASKPLPREVIAVLVAINCILIFVLYVVDRYYVVIQQGAVQRALDIECALNLRLSWAIAGVARTDRVWRYASILQYGLFVFASLALGLALVLAQAPSGGSTGATSGSPIVFSSGAMLSGLRDEIAADLHGCLAGSLAARMCPPVTEISIFRAIPPAAPGAWIALSVQILIPHACWVTPAHCASAAEKWVDKDWWVVLLFAAPTLSVLAVFFLGVKANTQTDQLGKAGRPVFAIRFVAFRVGTPALAAGASTRVTLRPAADNRLPATSQLLSASRDRDNAPGEDVRIVNCQISPGEIVFTLANFAREWTPAAIAGTDDIYSIWYVDSPPTARPAPA
jgi:hypothetical protein